MTRLRFKRADVKPCIEHARAATTHCMPYNIGKPNGPDLWLVKDGGIYLMSNGLPVDSADEGTKRFVAYADGFNPKDQRLQRSVGRRAGCCWADDFAEALGLTDGIMRQVLARSDLIVGVLESQLEIYTHILPPGFEQRAAT